MGLLVRKGGKAMSEINKAAQALSLSRTEKTLECQECGKEFKARDVRARFCTDRCRQIVRRRNAKK